LTHPSAVAWGGTGWHRRLPPDAAVLLSSRGVRTFADGCVSVLLPVYLLRLGLTSPAYW